MAAIKVLHYSTHNEDCGIGKYQEQFLVAMAEVASNEIYNEFFEYSPNVTKVMSHDEFSFVLRQLKRQLKNFDILHIQHELSFYKHDEFNRIIDMAHRIHKKVLVTVHTAPDAEYKAPRRQGYGPHSIMQYLREIKAANEFKRVHIEPIKKADLVLVHNVSTRNNLISHGVAASKIRIITLPVPSLSFDLQTDEIKKALHYQSGDIILGAVGFISATKGVKAAVKALSYLPENYKLALVGGVHPSGGGEKYLDEVCDLIIKLKLKNRVYITGYVEDDAKLNALIRECDACIYPYSNNYYQYVSSAALNNAIANHKPAIVYPTRPFIEMNTRGTIAICKSANYYELARYVVEADYEKLAEASKEYAETFSYLNEARNLIAIYHEQLKTRSR